MTDERKLSFSARKNGQEGTAYLPLERQGLRACQRICGGTGEAADPFQYEIQIENASETPWEGVIHVGLARRREDPWILMPGFLYGTNRGDTPMEGQRMYPRIRESLAKPASPWWMVRGDKLSHPAVLIWNGGRIFGFHASPYWTLDQGEKKAQIGRDREFVQYAGFTCHAYLRADENENLFKAENVGVNESALSRAENADVDASGTSGAENTASNVPVADTLCQAGYTLGYENAPWLFVDSMDVRERGPLEGQCFRLEAGEQVRFFLYVYDYEAAEPLEVHRAIENVYMFYHESPVERATIRESVQALAEAVWKYAWLPERRQYSLFVFNAPGSDQMNFRELGSFSWTNGLSVAVPMLMSGVRLGDEKIKEQALYCIDAIVGNCMNERSELPYDGYMNGEWTVRGWWFDCMKTPGHTGYLVGQGTYYLLKAYGFMKRFCGEEHPEWLAFARRVIEKTERQKNQDGEYPYILSEETGAGLEYDSFGSVWCLAAAAAYLEAVGEPGDSEADKAGGKEGCCAENGQYRMLLDGVRASEAHYYQSYVRKCECYGGPLDISKGMDSEGILAYIRAAAALHRITGEEIYLRHLRDGIAYELTFKFCYNSPVKVPPLARAGWCSCGGSITSVVNPHIHPMSSTIVDELLYYAEQTKDPYIRERAGDVLLWGCQTYNHYDGEYDYGKKGWMSERFCYSQGLVKERYPDGTLASTWFALMPWASASVLEGMTGDAWE